MYKVVLRYPKLYTYLYRVPSLFGEYADSVSSVIVHLSVVVVVVAASVALCPTTLKRGFPESIKL